MHGEFVTSIEADADADDCARRGARRRVVVDGAGEDAAGPAPVDHNLARRRRAKADVDDDLRPAARADPAVPERADGAR